MASGFIIMTGAMAFAVSGTYSNVIMALWLALAIIPVAVLFAHWYAPERTMSQIIEEARR
jgi:hypothetical protein